LILILTAAGCRRPATPTPGLSGHVNLQALIPLHPAWSQLQSLKALIDSAHESHQHPIPPFEVPPEPSLPPVPLGSTRYDARERERMERVIQERIQRDLAALQEKVRQEVERFRKTEEAAAIREIRLEAEAAEPAFRQRYRAVAEQYADKIAPLSLRAVGLEPRLTDLLLLSPEERDERARQLAELRQQIDQVVAERNAELRRLVREFEAERAAARAVRLAQADAAVAIYEQERVRELQIASERQQRQIRQDLERSLRLQIDLPEIRLPRPGPTAEAARRRAAVTSASAAATMEQYHEAARDVEHQLYVQRQELERLIGEATRVAVLQLAREQGIDVRFEPAGAGAELTQKFAGWLHEYWQVRSVRS
jgi:hypothetical protein